MYLNKKKKFSCELVLETLRGLLKNIKLIADDFYKPDKNNDIEESNETLRSKIHYLKSKDIALLPLDLIFNVQEKIIIRQIANDFIKGNKLSDRASMDFVYQELIKILGDENFYLLDSIELKQSISLFESLKESVNKDISSTKMFVIPVIGIYLNKGEKCKIGSIEFVNSSDFINQYDFIFKDIESNKKLKNNFEIADTLALVKIKNRDSFIAQKAKEEIIKRVYTLIRIVLPRIGYQYCFVGTLGEEYLNTRFSFSLKLDNSDKLTSLTTSQTRNHFSENNINLLEYISQFKLGNDIYKDGTEWFKQCESIITTYVNGEEVTNFQKRVWIALYWLGEAMIEKEINSLIIKYATCLEALFNSREGGISEQISEFTAFIVGGSKEERVNIYDDIKNLYKLRSKAVHGGSTGINLDDRYLGDIQHICERSVISMAHYSGQEPWQNSKGHQNFVQYILRDYRFS